MAADESDMRSVLREHGIDVPARGRLSAEHKREYLRITGRLEEDDDSGAEWDGDDDGADITEAVIPDRAPTAPEPDRGAPPAERKPRRVKKEAPSLASRLRGGTRPPAKKKARIPRVPVDRIISRAWETGARLFAPISLPVARTLAIQGPVAGLVLEDTVRGTIVDTVLQPVARAEQRAEKVFALAGPPLLVAAIERAQGLESPRREMQLALLQPMLAEALTTWVRIADSKVEEAGRRYAETEETRAAVQNLIDQIWPAQEPEPEMAAA